MTANTPTIVTFAIYLLGMLLIGWAGYKATSNLSDYILGGRSLGLGRADGLVLQAHRGSFVTTVDGRASREATADPHGFVPPGGFPGGLVVIRAERPSCRGPSADESG